MSELQSTRAEAPSSPPPSRQRWVLPRPTFSCRSLLDDLVGPQQQRWRDRQAERLGGLEVDHQLELRGLLDREVGGLGALEDFVDVGCGAPPEIREIRPVGHEPTSIHEGSEAVDCRQSVLRYEFRDPASVRKEEGRRLNE